MMRFFEMIKEQEIVQQLEKDSVDTIKNSKDLPSQPNYATNAQQKPMADKIENILKADFPSARVDRLTNKIIPHIRIRDAFPKQEAVNKLMAAGLNLSDKKDPKQISTSDTFQSTTYSLEDNGVLFTIVLAGKGQEGAAQIGIQSLRPEKFGLTNQEKTKKDLANFVKSKIPLVVKDQIFQQGLIQLVDVAIGSRSSVDQNLMNHMSGILNYISQDFGEILTPLVMAKDDNEVIKFPEKSNKPLIDAEINGKPIAVKSLGGSGNSFIVIKDLIDSYVDTKRKEDPEFKPSQSYDILKDFVSTDGKTLDKLIRAAQRARIPEAIKMNEILGVSDPPLNYAQLKDSVEKLVNKLKSEDNSNLYKRYLEIISPAAFAANRMTKPKEGRKSKKEFVPKPVGVGLPADYKKYTGVESEDDVEENKRSAGKKSFDQDFVKAATRQLTYMLGVGFRNHVVEGPAAQEMADTITDIMQAKDAVAAKIEILPAGTIKVTTVAFSDLKFGYQYHAGTKTVDQNAPGFHIYFLD